MAYVVGAPSFSGDAMLCRSTLAGFSGAFHRDIFNFRSKCLDPASNRQDAGVAKEQNKAMGPRILQSHWNYAPSNSRLLRLLPASEPSAASVALAEPASCTDRALR